MSSHLTRRVFRSILANEPIVHRGCLRRRNYGSIRALPKQSARCAASNGRCVIPKEQRRTFFMNMFGGGKDRDSKEADLDPGIEKMMEYVKMDKMKARLPPVEEVTQAFVDFIEHKYTRRQPIEDSQAELATRSLRYYLDSGMTVQDIQQPRRDIITAGRLLRACAVLHLTMEPTMSHVELASLINSATSTAPSWIKDKVIDTLVKTLSLSGRPHDARQLVLERETKREMDVTGTPTTNPADEEDLPSETLPNEIGSTSCSLKNRHMWNQVLAGFAAQGSEDELLETLEMMGARGGELSLPVSRTMLQFYLRGDKADVVKTWWSHFWRFVTAADGLRRPAERVVSRRADIIARVLRWSLRHDEIGFGQDVVREALSGTPPKLVWDAVFVWAAGTGKGADEIDRMFTVMESANKKIADQTKWSHPDIVTINALVEYATSKNDPYLAERFIAIGKARDIQPDANTYVLQMKYRLKISDIDGALIAYKNLQSMDLSSHQDVPTVNELITALCKSQRHDFDTIMNVAADLSDRKARFEPATAAALALLHLNRDEMHDVTDLMNTHAYHYSTSEREAVRRELVAFCLDPKTPLSRVWDAYNVLADIFDEMPRDERTQIMLVFFRRERPDVSVNIFNSMRAHYRADTIPTVDTYVAAFLATAKLRNLDTLEVIHNQLKLDYNIDTTTYLLNALMIGYSASGNPRRALTFWDDIVASKEGPTYNSIQIALRACEKSPFGDLKADRIWVKLRSMNVDLDQPLWASYIAALAGNGNTEKAISTLEEAESKNELEVDAFLVGSLFAGCNGQVPQTDVESWCKERHPQIWEDLEKMGVDEDENGMRSFRIDRTVTP